MNAVRSYGFSALALVTLTAIGVVRWRGALPVPPTQPSSFGSTFPEPSDSLDALLDDAEEFTVSNDPFRLANAPAAVRYDPNKENIANGSIVAVAPPPLRPTLTLKAIVGGPPWQAIVDGIPGQPQSTLVRAGSAFDKLVARSVTRDNVIIQGPDTTWVLGFRKP